MPPAIITSASLNPVTSEKGEFAAGQTAFDAKPSFGAIVDHIASADPILLCDDLRDEWADFTGVTDDAGLTQISFYHAEMARLPLVPAPSMYP